MPELPTAAVEALLFAAGDPVTTGQLAQALDCPEAAAAAALAALAQRLEASGSGLLLRRTPFGWQLVTGPQFATAVTALGRVRQDRRLSAAALEVLAIVAYRQPVTRGQIDGWRGVDSGNVLTGLVERGLVRPVGRAERPGHPVQYGTTAAFLATFGLASLAELPPWEPPPDPA